jgi:hypothetical protein
MPLVCPHTDCDERFPKHPSMTLRRMIKKRNDELKKARGDETATRVYTQGIFICLQVKDELRKEKYLEMRDKTWPTVDFAGLSERVLLIKSEVIDIIENDKKRAKSLVYQKLLSALGGKAQDLRKIAKSVMPPGIVMKISRPG